MSDESPTPPSVPQIDGWEARFVGQEPRLSEVVDLYRELGFEVRIEPYKTGCSAEGECEECFKDSPTPVFVVYVSKIENKS